MAGTNPYAKANFLSKLFFCWINPLLSKGKIELSNEDLYNVLPDDSSKKLGDILSQKWNSHRPNLLRAILHQFGFAYFLWGLLALFEECFLKIAQPLLLGQLILYFSASDSFEVYQGPLFAFGLVFIALLIIFTNHPFSFGVTRIGMRVRIALTSLVYRKSLKLSQTSLGSISVGQMVNFLSNDVSRIELSAIYFHYIWIGPILTGIVIIILWNYFGSSCLAGMGVILLTIPLQGFIGKLFAIYRTQISVKTDGRLRIISEIIGGLKSIKMYAWEGVFKESYLESRKNELQFLRKMAHLRALNFGLSFTTSKITFFATLLTYFYLDGDGLVPENIFVALALYNNLRLVMAIQFPQAVSQMAETFVSIRRLEEFLLMDEKPTLCKSSENSENSICLEKISARWSNSSRIVLENISFNVRQGQLVALIGPIGSGKSSLLHVLLRELESSGGSLKLNGELAYASQETWIFSGSIRENILMGRHLDKVTYFRTLKATALDKDLANFPNGDKSLLIDQGAILSGGQRARIGLARAAYSNADIFLLDDVTSAVDAQVGRHLFEKCINGILRDKTRILVTHQLEFLKYADFIIEMEEGRIKNCGTFTQLNSMGQDEDEELDDFYAQPPSARHRKSSIIHTANFRKRRDSIYTDAELLERLEESRKKSTIPESRGLQIHEESIGVGELGFGIFWNYFRNGSNWLTLTLLVLSNLALQTLFTGSDFWLSYWVKLEEQILLNSFEVWDNITFQDFLILSFQDEYLEESRPLLIMIYSIFIGSILVMSLCRTFLFFQTALRSTRKLHQNLFQGILYSPMHFFDKNPVGRVFSRFSRDTGNIDDVLPVTFYDTLQIFINIFGILVSVAILNPLILIPALPLSLVFYFLRRFYISTARNIKRLEGVNRSPIYSHISTTYQGISTIRAFQVEEQYSEKFDQIQDVHTCAWFLFLAATRWFGIRLDLISATFLALLIISFMTFSPDGNGANVGLAISQTMMLTGMFQWGIRQSAELENQFVSVERVLDYSKIEPEASLQSTLDKSPPKNWPNRGEMCFKNLELKCDDTILLRDISCFVKPTEKIGIVGRTGAGKSSLITALFRIIEPSKGSINIDGVDILKIGLHELRTKVSIIPQEPFLFLGSLRRNLDPFQLTRDSELWKVLQDVHLAEKVKNLEGGLDSIVSEGGVSFSRGQQQLICLARALLRKNKILILDEATANCDTDTDALIQETIRNKFGKCTVLTIAHRLITIMDSDRILVLDKGKVKEFDSPFELLQNETSALSQLVAQVDRSVLGEYISIATKKEFSKNCKGSDDEIGTDL